MGQYKHLNIGIGYPRGADMQRQSLGLEGAVEEKFNAWKKCPNSRIQSGESNCVE
jgi:hypothetical protein